MPQDIQAPKTAAAVCNVSFLHLQNFFNFLFLMPPNFNIQLNEKFFSNLPAEFSLLPSQSASSSFSNALRLTLSIFRSLFTAALAAFINLVL